MQTCKGRRISSCSPPARAWVIGLSSQTHGARAGCPCLLCGPCCRNTIKGFRSLEISCCLDFCCQPPRLPHYTEQLWRRCPQSPVHLCLDSCSSSELWAQCEAPGHHCSRLLPHIPPTPHSLTHLHKPHHALPHSCTLE